MASKEETKPAATAPAKKSGKGRILVIAGALLLTLGAGGGAWWFLNRDNGEAPVARAAPAEPPVFVPLENFTVNLQPEAGGSQQYLQIGITLKVVGQEAAEKLKAQMPEVRSRLLLLLSAKKAFALLSPEGKNQLSREMLVEVARVLDPAAAAQLPVSVAAAPAETRTDAGEQNADTDTDTASTTAPPASADAPEQTAAAETTEAAAPAAAEAPAAAPGSVLSVLFTSFIIQ